MNGSLLKIIKVKPQKVKEADEIKEKFGPSSVASRTLSARGYKADSQLDNFLDPTLKNGLLSPDEMLNLRAAANLIADAIKSKKSIAIACDFDVDGLTSGAQLKSFFDLISVVSYVFVPDRFEDGYGLNEGMINSARQRGCEVLVCVDFGTTNEKELSFAKKLGMSTVVLDHHEVRKAPKSADVFVNPMQTGCGFKDVSLCSAGLTWYLLIALKDVLAKSFPEVEKLDVREFLDLACLGTICDMVPLKGANRVIAKRGLERLKSTGRMGLQRLKEVSGIRGEVSGYDIGFVLGPRFNAAGRMVSGEIVIDLLTSADSIKASQIASKLQQLNLKRQEAEARVKEAALKQISKLYKDELPAALVVWAEDFHTGVVGIVAQRLVEIYSRPAVVLGFDKDGQYKGSVRGIKGFNVVKGLEGCAETLIKFGGHEAAGGLSLIQENLEKFREGFIAQVNSIFKAGIPPPYAEVDTLAGLEEVTFELVQELDRFAPFGMGNPAPTLLSKELKVMDVKPAGKQHLKAVFSDGRFFITGLLWRATEHPALVKGATVDIAYKPTISRFQGVAELQANLQAVQLSSS